MFLTQNKIINKENIPYLLSFIYPLLLIWQGLDVTDTGFFLSNYQLSFEDNQIPSVYVTWLTYIIGGMWWNWFGNLGVIGFKLLWVFMIWICFYLTYRLFKPYSSKYVLGWVLFITLLVATNRSGNWFNYNTMTSLLYIAGAWTLMEGIRQDSRTFLMMSGFLLGISVFARLPNILGISLAAIIVIHGILTNRSFQTMINDLLFFSLGVVISVSVVFIAMEWLNHRQLFIEEVQLLFSQAKTADSHHSIDYLLSLFLKDHIAAGISGIAAILGIIGISILAQTLFQPKSWLWWLSIFGLAVIAAVAFLLWHGFWRWMVPGIIYLILIAYIFGLIKQSIEYRILALIALGVLFLVPLGSRDSIYNAIYAMWIALPIALLFFIQPTTITIRHWKWSSESFNYAKVLILVALVLSSVAQAISYTYRDSKNRLEMTATIEHPLLTGVLTTNERAKVMQELLDELQKYVKPRDFILAYEGISLIYFLTQTRPYLYHTWPMLEHPTRLKNSIEKAELERSTLPIVVRAKASTSVRDWPNNFFDNRLKPYEYEKMTRQLIEDFLNRHQYVKIWENRFFEILQSK
ncbi:MAG: hypothetical protein ABFS56_20195 [Pseudomonadota bacterium]